MSKLRRSSDDVRLARVKQARRETPPIWESLTPGQVAEIELRVARGESPGDIGAMIQDEWGCCLDRTPSKLAKEINGYLMNNRRAEIIHELALRTKLVNTDTLAAHLHSIREIEELVMKQKKRVDKVLKKEDTLPDGLLLNQASDEISSLHRMLVDLGKLHLEAGILKRAPRLIAGQVADENGTMRPFAWAEGDLALVNLIEQVATKEGENASAVDTVDAEYTVRRVDDPEGGAPADENQGPGQPAGPG